LELGFWLNEELLTLLALLVLFCPELNSPGKQLATIPFINGGRKGQKWHIQGSFEHQVAEEINYLTSEGCRVTETSRCSREVTKAKEFEL